MLAGRSKLAHCAEFFVTSILARLISCGCGRSKTGRRMPDANIRRCASRRASASGDSGAGLFGVGPSVRGMILGPPGPARADGVEFEVTQSGGPVG